MTFTATMANDKDDAARTKATTKTKTKTTTTSRNTDKNNVHDDVKSFLRYRTGLLIFSVIYTFFFAGAFFGYGPMVIMLQQDEAFQWKCDNHDDINEATCPDQTSSILNVHFVATTMQVLSPFVGHLCDSKGPFAGMIYTTVTGIIGICLFIMSRALPVDQLLYPAFCFLGMCANACSIMALNTGGIYRDDVLLVAADAPSNDTNVETSATNTMDDEIPDPLTAEHQTKNADDDYDEVDEKVKDKGTRRVIGLLNNLYDAGTVTYLIMWKIQEATGAALQTLAYWYLGLAVVSFGSALLLWRIVLRFIQGINSKESSIRDCRTELVVVADSHHQTENEPTTTDAIVLEDNDQDDMKVVGETEKTDWELLRWPPYLWVVAFFSFHVCRNQFMLTSSESFLEDLGDSGNRYITIFALIMPASIVGFPFVDFALGKYGYHASLQVINVLGVIHGVIQLSTDNLNVQVFGFVVFSFYRCFLFSVIFALLAVLMPQKVLGKANGLMFVASGITGFVNIPLGSAAIQQWNGSFFYPNLIYTVSILPFFYAAYGATCVLGMKNETSDITTTKKAGSAVASEGTSFHEENAAA